MIVSLLGTFCDSSMSYLNFSSTLLFQHKRFPARVMRVTTPHGTFETPTFMPVATRASINGLQCGEIIQTGTDIILGGNTYHMMCSPGMEVIRTCGGMHRFMNWSGPMLTDSGGFQVFSLSRRSPRTCIVNDEGAHFQHPNTGQIIRLTPKTSIMSQKIIGADIIMAFDECTTHSYDRNVAIRAMDRTHIWLKKSKEIHEFNPCSEYGHRQALFGIIQGDYFRDLREQSTNFVLSMETDGIAIGGEIIGRDMRATDEIIDWVVPSLPRDKLRYTMGVGLGPQDLISVVQRGIDIFDCVSPTRNARHGSLYHGHPRIENDWLKFDTEDIPGGKLLIKKGTYENDDRPILEGCECFTCKTYSRAYLRYLFKSRQMLYGALAGIHNIRVMQNVCDHMKTVIKQNHATT